MCYAKIKVEHKYRQLEEVKLWKGIKELNP